MNELADHLKVPSLRPGIEVRMEEINAQQVLLLRCTVGIKKEPLALNPIIIPILQRFTGRDSVTHIQEELSSQGATLELILQVAQLLDESSFLEGPTFQSARKEFMRSFHENPVREAALAGLSYPAAPEQLTQQINTYLTNGADVDKKLGSEPPRCLITPHIDYQRGHECYGRAFRALSDHSPDVILLIGTSHQYSPHLFHLTKKHFDTPFGAMSAESECIEAIASDYGSERAYADEFLHKQEHSLELQLPFLKHLSPKSTLIPVLVGGFHHLVQQNNSPHSYEPYERFLEALSNNLEKHVLGKGKTLLVLAGVDMAHVGSYFGDTRKLQSEWMKEIQKRDSEYIDHIIRQNKDALFEHIVEDQDERRVCGFPTLYSVLDLFDRFNWNGTNTLLDYRQSVNYQTDCAVTFAGIAMYP